MKTQKNTQTTNENIVSPWKLECSLGYKINAIEKVYLSEKSVQMFKNFDDKNLSFEERRRVIADKYKQA